MKVYDEISNAKINLFLHVLNKREDGFHNILSLFLPVSFGDRLRIILNTDNFLTEPDKIEFQSINLISLKKPRLEFEEVSEKGNFKKNLIYKLFEILLTKGFKIPKLSIRLYKKIPPGSGLGGGSGNVGALLRFLVKVGILNFNEAYDVAISLGSDIPFFLYNKPSWVMGRGEIIEPLKNSAIFSGLYGILCLNEISVSTKLAYEMLKRPLDKKGFDYTNQKKQLSNFLNENIENFFNFTRNDFEEPVLNLYPELWECKENLMKTQPLLTRMTGSGSALFSLYNDKKKMIESLRFLNKMDSSRSFSPFRILTGQSPSGKASDFGSDIRRFESSLPSH